MANIIKNFLDSLHLSDDDEEDDEAYADYVDKTNMRERRQAERRVKKERESTRPVRSYSNDIEEEEPEEIQRSNGPAIVETKRERERSQRAERQASKVVPFRSSSNGAVDIHLMMPTSVDDAQDICDVLLSGRSATINLEGFDAEQAQRVMDFISGAVYATHGKLEPISKYIFIISPESVEISGDYLEKLKESGFGVPIINRD